MVPDPVGCFPDICPGRHPRTIHRREAGETFDPSAQRHWRSLLRRIRLQPARPDEQRRDHRSSRSRAAGRDAAHGPAGVRRRTRPALSVVAWSRRSRRPVCLSNGGRLATPARTDRTWLGLQISTTNRPAEDLSRLTPPWHATVNARDIEAWQFRNAENTGPNDGSVNAPGGRREFIFSPLVGRGIEYGGSVTSADVEKVRVFGRGWLFIESYRLTAPRRGGRADFESLTFWACLSWPAG